MSQDLCIKKSLQGISELCGRAFCKYIAQNNRTVFASYIDYPRKCPGAVLQGCCLCTLHSSASQEALGNCGNKGCIIYAKPNA